MPPQALQSTCAEAACSRFPHLHNSMMAVLAMKDSQSHESHPGAPLHVKFMLLLEPALRQSIGPKAEGVVILAGRGLAL